MARNLATKILAAHLVSGELVPGEEIALKIDHCLLQDATGTMAMLEFMAMGIDRVKVEVAAQYIDHNLLQTDYKNADDHAFMAQFHKPGEEKRTVVVLPPAHWDAWLRAPAANSHAYLQALPAEQLAVHMQRGVLGGPQTAAQQAQPHHVLSFEDIGNARVSLGISAAVIQNAITRFPSAMGPFATFGPLRFNWTQTELDDVAAFIAQDVAAGTPSTGVDRGQPMYTAMCSSCHGGAARGGERMVKATHPEKTLSAIASDQGGMGSLSFMTHEQATDIAIYIGAAGPTGGLKGYLEGGCTLGRSDAPMDPIWLLMLLGATGTLELRRRGRV